jgi:hypothetical protein
MITGKYHRPVSWNIIFANHIDSSKERVGNYVYQRDDQALNHRRAPLLCRMPSLCDPARFAVK